MKFAVLQDHQRLHASYTTPIRDYFNGYLQTNPLGRHNLQTTPVFEKFYKLPSYKSGNYTNYPRKIKISQTTPAQNSSTIYKLSPHRIQAIPAPNGSTKCKLSPAQNGSTICKLPPHKIQTSLIQNDFQSSTQVCGRVKLDA